MPKIIYKYSLSSKDCPGISAGRKGEPFEMEMVKGAEILAVREQEEVNSQGIAQTTGKIWVLVDAKETEKETRYFRLIGTGEEFNDVKEKYIGTYQLYNGETIVHLFEHFNGIIYNS